MSSRSQPQKADPALATGTRESIDARPDVITPPLGGMRRMARFVCRTRISGSGAYPFWGYRCKVRAPILRSCGGVRLRYGGLWCDERRINPGDESGIALVMALGIMLVLTIALTTVITFTASGARDSKRVNAGQKATALAEAGLSNALAVLNQNYPVRELLPRCRDAPAFANDDLFDRHSDVVGDSESCRRRLRLELRVEADPLGTVTNPTGPTASPVRRTVRATVPIIIPGITEIGDNNPLNFIYAKRDLTFLQSVEVASPVYAKRDLHLENSSTISEFIGNDPCLAEPGRDRGSDVRRAEREQDRTRARNGNGKPARRGLHRRRVQHQGVRQQRDDALVQVRRHRPDHPAQNRPDLGRGHRERDSTGLPRVHPGADLLLPVSRQWAAGARGHAAGIQQHGQALRDRPPGAARAVPDRQRPVHLRRRRRAGQPDQQQRHADRHARDQPDADVVVRLSVAAGDPEVGQLGQEAHRRRHGLHRRQRDDRQLPECPGDRHRAGRADPHRAPSR